uniref:Podocin n=1 Tax=Naja naja TaxID=35670 RepID=A0A8C6XIE1_NAJNA
MRFGHVRKNVSRGPGVYFILPFTDSLTKVDMRTKVLELPFQEIFTKDPLIIDVDGVVHYRVRDALLAVTKISDADAATSLLAKAIMKNTLGSQTLSHLISDREKVARRSRYTHQTERSKNNRVELCWHSFLIDSQNLANFSHLGVPNSTKATPCPEKPLLFSLQGIPHQQSPGQQSFKRFHNYRPLPGLESCQANIFQTPHSGRQYLARSQEWIFTLMN